MKFFQQFAKKDAPPAPVPAAPTADAATAATAAVHAEPSTDNHKDAGPSSGSFSFRFGEIFDDIKNSVSNTLKKLPQVVDHVVEDQKRIFESEREKTKRSIESDAKPTVEVESDSLFWLSVPTELLDDDNFHRDLSRMVKKKATFTQPPPVDSGFVFSFEEQLPKCLSAMKAEPYLSRARFIVVPKYVPDALFWQNFFYHLERLIQVHLRKDPGGLDSIYNADSPAAKVSTTLDDTQVHQLEADIQAFKDKIVLLSELMSVTESREEVLNNNMIRDLVRSCRAMKNQALIIVRSIPAATGVNSHHKQLTESAGNLMRDIDNILGNYERRILAPTKSVAPGGADATATKESTAPGPSSVALSPSNSLTGIGLGSPKHSGPGSSGLSAGVGNGSTSDASSSSSANANANGNADSNSASSGNLASSSSSSASSSSAASNATNSVGGSSIQSVAASSVEATTAGTPSTRTPSSGVDSGNANKSDSQSVDSLGSTSHTHEQSFLDDRDLLSDSIAHMTTGEGTLDDEFEFISDDVVLGGSLGEGDEDWKNRAHEEMGLGSVRGSTDDWEDEIASQVQQAL